MAAKQPPDGRVRLIYAVGAVSSDGVRRCRSVLAPGETAFLRASGDFLGGGVSAAVEFAVLT